MRTELIHIDNVPNEQELMSLLGNNIYEYYCILYKAIILFLTPDLEIWDYAGRRGKYLHGYRINNQSMLVDLYLSSVNEQGQLNCEFKFDKRAFYKIVKKKGFFSENTQKNIDSTIEANEKYGGFYLDVIINNETLQDAIQIIQIMGAVSD